MNEFVLSIVSLLVGLGLGYFALPAANQEPSFGGVIIDQDHFVNGFYAGEADEFSVDGDGDLSTSGGITNTGSLTGTLFASGSVGSSSSSPAALGSAVAGHFIVAAGSTTANASTTAVTANSSIQLTVEQTTPIAGTTCNTTIPTSTPVVLSKTAHATNGGFRVQVANSPITNPLCLSYWIIN